jgi:DNA invertase Pin-like site-specific DNA recombinase
MDVLDVQQTTGEYSMTGLEKLCSMVMNGSGKRRKHKHNRFVIYLRVSTKRQGESGLGLEAQRAAAQAYVREHNGEIIAEYQEVETGKNCQRPELLKAVMHANKSWSTLLIAKLDRLARNVWFCSTLMESGIDFVACDCPQASKLTVHILASIAEHEAELISCRTRDALAAYKARGGVLGPATFKNPEQWKVQQEQSRKLATLKNALVAYAANEESRMIAKSLRAEGLSFQAIADELNRRDFRTRMGKAFGKSQAKRLVDYAGVQSSENVVSAQG